ncbi:MAG: NADH-quinone oxidoreductase subunit M [Bacteriovoracaceae bacterium]|nr:NADH-quinone oxidoreductase subunit M [Bacteriovoracaceae bacterium]
MGAIILNLVLWLPMLSALGLLIFTSQSSEDVKRIKWISLISTAFTFLLTLDLLFYFDFANPSIQPALSMTIPWISSFHINYTLGIDGISYSMLFLNNLLFPICILCSWNIEKNPRSFFALMLFLQTTIIGVFSSLDFFMFYCFWEFMLIPMFFLISVWGGENREYAATKFFLYTFGGSIFMLVAIIGIYFVSDAGPDSLNMIAMQGGLFAKKTIALGSWKIPFSDFAFWLLFIGFAVKVPLFPFHTWLPHAHVQAPTAVSVILAGVLLKMGTYGFLRISYPIFPEAAAAYSYVIVLLGLISVIYGAFCALAQTDMKKLIAYSSVSHMGFVMMGLGSLSTSGTNGAVLQMFNHGLSSAMLFLLVGVLYERSHHRWIVRPDHTLGYTGLSKHMPKYTIVMLISLFAALGLPGLSSFISEFLIFLGAFKSFTLLTILGAIGLLFGAAYLLWMYRRMFFGTPSEEVKTYEDMNWREILYMAPLCFLVIFLGIMPAPLIDLVRFSVENLVKKFTVLV